MFFSKEKCICEFFVVNHIFLLKLVIRMIRLSHVREHGKCSGYACLTLIFVSKVRVQALVKINYFSENKLIVGLNSNCCDCSIKKNRKKMSGFWQTDMVECLIDERKLSMMKLDFVWSHLSKAFNSKKLFNAFNCHKEIGWHHQQLCHLKWLEVSEEQFK